VADWYLPFVSYQFLASIFSAAGGVIATQSLLYSVGMGLESLPLSAGINWVLKDGIGQLGGMIFAR